MTDILLWWFGMFMAAAVVLALFLLVAYWLLAYGLDRWVKRQTPKPWVSDAQLDKWIADGETLWDKPV